MSYRYKLLQSSSGDSSDTSSRSSDDTSPGDTPPGEVSWDSDGESLPELVGLGCYCLCPVHSCRHQFSMLPHSSGGAVNHPPYFIDTIQHRRSGKRAKSPLSGIPPVDVLPIRRPDEAEYDYSNTARWGWVILICTWTVFVIGIGTCFGVWSWAWDGGKTSVDDSDLPIKGYYVYLFILSCVMAWVWITTAWMGMKYFRHARAN
ncbi:MAG: hypothetical protein M1829_002950 [Trizodia sp. TS-e1964]|nr:MAG: hypothetical protein M1829_002950 [Trizodia sp. TS-e1964]